MDEITDVSLGELENSQYIKTMKMYYTQDGKKKSWDLMKSHDSVAILIRNRTRDSFVFVKQFRPAVYCGVCDYSTGMKAIDTTEYPGKLGITYELCAGIIDKNKPPILIAKEEVLEECGYEVDICKLQKITSMRSGVGLTGSLQTLYFAEVNDLDKVTDGGGNPHEGEFIETIEIPIKDSLDFIMNEDIIKPAGLVMAVLWYDKFKKKV